MYTFFSATKTTPISSAIIDDHWLRCRRESHSHFFLQQELDYLVHCIHWAIKASQKEAG